MPSSSSAPIPQTKTDLETVLSRARPFLRGEYESIDPNLPTLLSVLRSVGASECWHKHGSFYDHLVDMYRILKIWNTPESVCLCGLFHSAYSNSYVNLAIFDPSTGRETVRDHVGEAAERLIHLFCIVPRQTLIHDDLLFHYSDQELVEHLKLSELSVKNAKELGVFDPDEVWRKKLNSILPCDGISVKHIKSGDEFMVSRRVIATFVLMTMADFSDQLFGFQDILFDNENGRLEFTGNNFTSLWPGNGKPGLWMNSISRMGALYSLLVREEEIFIEEKKRVSGNLPVNEGRDEEIELVIPPVFEYCTKVLDAGDQIIARDLYWEAVCDGNAKGLDKAEELLLKSIEGNPFVGEPHIVLGQIYLITGRFEEGDKEAEVGLKLLLEWGSPWDKRMSWEGWIAWSRVLVMKAKEKSWPQTSFGILNLGLVK
ncbi:hypothetical protein MKW98_027747 [Papaver atlanticum]|uniref:DUF6817 domain-containing protein n=1 Tax=Papaver atlanticum TaxID=357466 RepID=A0AAD4XV80_9MAGN|nr:hypothetical protein MKW98_027747 [Papaver atlanticum]